MTDSSPRLLVLGLGKSGSTWIAHSLAQSLGLPYYNEPGRAKTLALLAKPGGLVVKQIYENWEKIEPHCDRFDDIFAIERDPLDVALSKWLWNMQVRREAPYDLMRKLMAPDTVSILDLLPWQGTYRRSSDFRKKLAARSRVHIVRYEDFVAGNLSAWGSYASRIQAHDLDDREATRKRRAGKPGNWRRWLNEDDTSRVRAFLTREGLHAPGYDDWTISDEPITLDETFDYLLRLGDLTMTKRWSLRSLSEIHAKRRSAPYRLYSLLDRSLVRLLRVDRDVLRAKG